MPDPLAPDRHITLPLGLVEAIARDLDRAATAFASLGYRRDAKQVREHLLSLRRAIAAATLPPGLEPCPHEVARMVGEGCPNEGEHHV